MPEVYREAKLDLRNVRKAVTVRDLKDRADEIDNRTTEILRKLTAIVDQAKP